MNTIYVTYAVEGEFISLQMPDCDIVYIQTGIGKTKSASILTKYICERKPDLVLNIGTAGTIKHNVGDIFIANRFIDRDFEATKLPGIEFEIDGIELLNNHIGLKNWVSKQKKSGICSTGDTFITEIADFRADFVDMEAYAQAYTCKEFGVPFLSVKYITDIIGENSIAEWESKLEEAKVGLKKWFEENLNNL
ncbi:MAG: 5'-methylthioadenosine/S-adenosylhomocysteine nucleosidase [Dysgonamonadaceae bacterium]|jgi:adenosylhomocysteine nucleosidase|nr:5'-methylthioadenosine/S-adenosylhomocysteine nucleosidase [Dysgonamonadaceae bacterium]